MTLTDAQKASIIAAAVSGLTGNVETATRTPRSIAIKAVQIANDIEDVLKNGIPAKTEKK